MVARGTVIMRPVTHGTLDEGRKLKRTIKGTAMTRLSQAQYVRDALGRRIGGVVSA